MAKPMTGTVVRVGPRAGRRPPGTWQRSAVKAASLAAGIAIWQVVGTWQPHILASFTAMLAGAAIAAHARGPLNLGAGVALTLEDMLVGYGVALAVGIPLGVLMGLNRTVQRIADMYLGWMLAIPEIALIPFFIVALGLGTAARLAVVLVFALPVIVQNTLAGVASVSPSWLEMAQGFEASRRQIALKVQLPGALPLVLTGARMGLGRALMGIVSAGFFIQMTGLGGLVYYYQDNFQLGAMFFAILVVVVIGLAASEGIQFIEQRLTRWNRDAASA